MEINEKQRTKEKQGNPRKHNGKQGKPRKSNETQLKINENQ